MLKKHIQNTFLTNIVLYILSFGSSVFLNRYLSADLKGEYILITSFLELAVLFLGLSITTSIIYYIASKNLNRKSVVITIFYFNLIISLLFILLLLFFNEAILELLLPKALAGESMWLYLLPVSFFILITNSSLASYFQSQKRFDLTNKVSIVSTLFNVILIVSVYFLDLNEKVLIIFSIFLLSKIISLIIYIFHFLKTRDFSFKSAPLKNKELKIFFSYSFLAYFSNVFQFLNYKLDYWFVENIINQKALGHYSLSANLTQFLYMLPMTLSSVFISYVASDNKGNIANYSKVNRVLFLVLLLLTIFLIATSSFIIPLIYTDEFSASIIPFQILLISVPIYGSATYMASIIAGNGKIKYNMIASFIGLFFTIILDIILIPKFGINGAAIATSISFFITSIYVFITYNKIEKISFKKYFIIHKSDLIMLKKIFNGRK